MQDRSGKKKKDLNEKAFSLVQQLTGETPRDHEPDDTNKNPAAVALGRLGGLKGGFARAQKLTKKQLSEIGKKAAEARWKREK